MRLTYRDSTVPHTNAKGELWEAYSDANYNEVINKLAAYEDAEDQGRLVVLPCKVGDTFFFLSETIHGELYVAQSRVSNIVITGDALMIVDSDGCYHYTYWFTRAETEAALKGEQNDVG